MTFWKLLIKFIVSTYFHEATVHGVENIPEKGPIIFVGNHQNQFIDPMLLVANSPRPIGFLIAAKSMKGIVGFFASQFGCIPVARPQDSAQDGPGTINITDADLTLIVGTGTNFTKSLKPGHSIAPRGMDPKRVVAVLSDTEIKISDPFRKAVKNLPYKVLDKMDQSKVYEAVWNRLGNDQCIGIFPEGGSHDRSELLPLKAGVTLMALGAMAKYGQPVYIVPCGLNYFAGHRFRGSALIEFGKPFKIPMTFAEQYKVEQRAACNGLLKKIKEHMDTVIIQAPDHESLSVLQLTKRLYQPSNLKLEADQWLTLHHRFLEGFNKFQEEAAVKTFVASLKEYQNELKLWGLQDRHIDSEANIVSGHHVRWIMLWRFILCFASLALALPGSLLFAPVGIAARILANKWAKDSLKSSEVKIEAKDVLGSNKVIVALLGLPIAAFFYTLLVAYWWGSRPAFYFMMFLPFFGSLTVKFAEEGYSLVRSLKAMVILRFQLGEKIEELVKTRHELQTTIRGIVKKLGQKLAGDSELEDWRIIKEEQLTEPQKQKVQVRVKGTQKPFKTTRPIDKPLISNDEWDELKDIFS